MKIKGIVSKNKNLERLREEYDKHTVRLISEYKAYLKHKGETECENLDKYIEIRKEFRP